MRQVRPGFPSIPLDPVHQSRPIGPALAILPLPSRREPCPAE